MHVNGPVNDCIRFAIGTRPKCREQNNQQSGKPTEDAHTDAFNVLSK